MTNRSPAETSFPEFTASSSVGISVANQVPQDVEAPVDLVVSDTQTLRELEMIFGSTKLLDLLRQLKNEITQRLQAPATERDRLGHDAHILLSVCGSLGFHALSKCCSELEQAYLSGDDLAAALEVARKAGTQAIAAICAIEAHA